MNFTINQKKIIENYINSEDYKQMLFIYPVRYQFLEYALPINVTNKLPFVAQLKLISAFKRFYFNKTSAISFMAIDSEHNSYNCVMYGVKFLPKIKVGSIFNCICNIVDYHKIQITSLTTSKSIDELTGIFPIYRLKNKIKQFQIRNIMKKVISNYQIEDYLPIEISNKWKLYSYEKAIEIIHFPSNKRSLSLAVRTIKYRECLNFILNILYKQHQINDDYSHSLSFNLNFQKEIVSNLRFELTNDQKLVLNDTIKLCQSNKALNSIICGDVGCGKSIIAFLLMLSLKVKQQVVLVAPTEILAKQHYENLSKLSLNPVILLTAKTKNEAILQQIKKNQANLIIATHAAFSSDVEFNNLCLVIFDEQQRFGVNQRNNLITKMTKKNVLMLTATPIPRSLAGALSNYCSIQFINQFPNKDKTIFSQLLFKTNMNNIVNEMKKLIQNRQQIYVVCSSIYNQETGVLSIFKKLVNDYNLNANFIHSQLSSEVITQTVNDFSEKKFDILVSTTIIEVGIDIKNANGMFIFDADCFGLSQLHQLRGRVGRGSENGYCYFITNNLDACDKLEYLVSELDGFNISLYDLKMRGSGDWLGEKQSGYLPFAYFDPINDSKMVEYAINDATDIINNKYDGSLDFINQTINDDEYYF